MTAPTRPGFYWAKWLCVDRETIDGALLAPDDMWDVVFVFKNSQDAPLVRFRVLVAGVKSTQAVGNFQWGPGPLKLPS